MASELPSERASLTIASTEKAKIYIQSREIPQLFEALMTGLMFKQPEDHIDYIINCLQRVKAAGNNHANSKNQVKWNTFLTDMPTSKENTNPNQQSMSKEARILSGNKHKK